MEKELRIAGGDPAPPQALAPPSAVEEMLQIALELGASVDGAVAPSQVSTAVSAAEPAEPTEYVGPPDTYCQEFDDVQPVA